MKKVLDEIKSVPGVTGGFFFDSVLGVTACDLPSVFKMESLRQIGQILDKMFAMGKACLSGVADLSLVYDESIIIMRRIGKTSSLIIVTDPFLNQNLLAMSVNMLADTLAGIGRELESGGAGNDRALDESVAPVESISMEDLLNNSPLSPVLSKFQAALFEVAGPMAQLIFRDAVQAWMDAGYPSEQRIPELVKTLTAEISDPDKEEEYLKLII